jgi:ADP-L-glycero-D-manno-heptose 6-epimerase
MYIVTGGAGLIGSAVIARLNEAGIDDIVIVDDLGCSDKWLNIRGKKFIEYIHKDEFLRCITEDPEHWLLKHGSLTGIIHMGACSSTNELDMDYLFKNNIQYSQVLATLAKRKDARFIYASSAATYGAGERGFVDDEGQLEKLVPLNRYGYSKHFFDCWAENHGILRNAVGLKFFNVYGPNEYHKDSMRSPVTWGYEQIARTGKLRLFASAHPDYADGEHTRDFVYVKDCAEVIFWLLRNPGVNGLFNLGTGIACSWNEVAHSIFAAMGIEPNIEFVPMPEQLQAHYQYYTQADMTKLFSTKCPIRPRSVREGVWDYVKNYLEPGWLVY